MRANRPMRPMSSISLMLTSRRAIEVSEAACRRPGPQLGEIVFQPRLICSRDEMEVSHSEPDSNRTAGSAVRLSRLLRLSGGNGPKTANLKMQHFRKAAKNRSQPSRHANKGSAPRAPSTN